MDAIAIDQAFLDILGVDNDVRRRSEQALASLEGQPGLYPALVAIANSAQDMKIRQSAVLYLKNSCKAWRDSRRAKLGKPPIPEQDRSYLKSVILHCLKLSVPELIRVQYEEIAKVLAENLFPAGWGEVFGQLDEALQSSSEDEMYAGLSLLFQLCKNYEFNMRESRAELDLLVNRYFDHLLRCAELLQPSESSFPYLLLILKTYWVVTYIDIRPKLAAVQCFSAWLNLFKRTLEADLGPLESIPDNEELAQRREDMPAWGCKRWSAQILHRCFQRNANSSYLDAHMKSLTEYFVANYSLDLTRTALHVVTRTSQRFVPNIVLNYLFKFLTQAVKVPVTSSEVKAQVETLISAVIMPKVCRVPSDEVTWRENPVEFIHKENDLGRAYYSAKSAALDLLVALCSDRNVIVGFMKFLSHSLATGVSLLAKEALLLATGSLADLIKGHEDLAGSIESMLARYVAGELSSTVGCMRARACWTYGQFANFPLPDIEHQSHAFRMICQLLVDPELPVKFEAALALPKLLSLSASSTLLTPEVHNVLELYLKLMDEIDSEDLVDSLEALVDHFHDLVLPFAVSLSQKLADTFLRLASSNTADEEGDSALAAVSILNIEAKLLEMVQSQQDILAQLSHVLMPVMRLTLSDKGCEYFEEGLNIVSYLLYYGDEGSLPHLWELYPHLLVAIMGGPVEPYGLDHLEEVFSPLANFISKYKATFLERNGIVDISRLVTYLLHFDEDSSVSQHALIIKLLICLLENFQGRLDAHIPFFIDTARTLMAAREKIVRMQGVQLMAISCWYNPAIALTVLGEHVETALRVWFEHVPCYVSETGKRRMAFGLLALFLSMGVLQESASPQTIFLLRMVLQLLQALNTDPVPLPQHTSTPLQAEVSYQEVLESLRTRSLSVRRDEDPEWTPADEDLYDSPLEAIDEVMALRNALDSKH